MQVASLAKPGGGEWKSVKQFKKRGKRKKVATTNREFFSANFTVMM